MAGAITLPLHLELATAFPLLLRRFPSLAVAGDPEFRSAAVVHGLRHLPVSW